MDKQISLLFCAGVLQGDSLAPFLLIIALDYAMRSAIEGYEDLGFTLTERRSRRSPAVMITGTDFADDIALISDNLDKAQSLLEGVALHSNTAPARLNTWPTTSDTGRPYYPIVNSKLRQVDDFKYLQSTTK